MATHTVGIVVDRTFGARLLDLAERFHVWVIESPENRTFIEKAWEETGRKHGQAYELSSGVTSFRAEEPQMPEAACARIASTVDEHHGIAAHDPPWSRIEVFGVQLTPTLRRAFEEIGALSCSPTAEGFVCGRDV